MAKTKKQNKLPEEIFVKRFIGSDGDIYYLVDEDAQELSEINEISTIGTYKLVEEKKITSTIVVEWIE